MKKPAVNREIFIDTSGWIAASDRRDKYHAAARTAYQQLIEEKRILVTTNLIVAETYILIRRTSGHESAVKFLHSLGGSPRLLKIYSNAGLESQAERILATYADQDFSFADAVSFALMQERNLLEVFTFDRHFAVMGFQVLPGSG